MKETELRKNFEALNKVSIHIFYQYTTATVSSDMFYQHIMKVLCPGHEKMFSSCDQTKIMLKVPART